MSDDPETPWWARLFAPSGPSGNKPATYRELVARVEELEEQLAVASREAARYRHRVSVRGREDQEQLERLRLAVTWYADLANYRPYGLAKLVRALEDRGHRARVALGRLS